MVAPAASARPTVCIQGLGFVGAAMAAAVADAQDEAGAPRFDVVGVDLPTTEGRRRVAALEEGRFPFESVDPRLAEVVAAARRRGNLRATTDPAAYERASIAVVDVHLDVALVDGRPAASLDGLRAAVRTLGERLPPGALVVVETTVPPGTTAHVVAPELARALEARGLPADAVLLAHSYERVMPGPEYLHSITHFWRVYAGHTEAAAEACREFLTQFIDTRAFPLRRLASTTASETAKVLENSYRATTIAFIDEWGRFAERIGVDLFEVIDAIRVRPTHSNIRQPGLGVGGYCLTKDPYFPLVSARQIFDEPSLAFPFCTKAVETNARMPVHAVDRLEALLGGSLAGKRVLVLGVSYRSDVGDTRYSPSETFVREVERRGATVVCHDPWVRHWQELDRALPEALPAADGFDAAVLAVPHREYVALDVAGWVGASRCAVLDCNRVLGPDALRALRARGVRTAVLGSGATS